ncbi:MAG: hypothetical protein WCP20_12510 [Desulfuromonadales bacterium]
MSDHVLIYLIVILNALCQTMLIWRQKLEPRTRWQFCCLAIAIPLAIMVAMRFLIANGIIHGRVADQSLVEQYITKGTSVLLIAGPWLVTVVAIINRRRHRLV